MKNKLKLFGIYLPAFLVLTLSAVVLRTVALFVHFDFDTGYFSENILISIADYMTVALSLFLFTYIFAARKDIRLIPDFSSARTYVPTGLVSAALVFVAISLFAAKASRKRCFSRSRWPLWMDGAIVFTSFDFVLAILFLIVLSGSFIILLISFVVKSKR